MCRASRLVLEGTLEKYLAWTGVWRQSIDIVYGHVAITPIRGCYGDFDFASPDLNFYAGVSGMNWKRRPV